MPLGGGGCRPTLQLSTKSQRDATSFGWLEGPCAFGGWKGLLCGDKFTASSQPGRLGDLGIVNKRQAEGFWENFLRMFMDVNIYEFTYHDHYMKNISPEQKAVMLGSIMHLNYLYFENDAPPVYCESLDNGKGCCIYCTLFNFSIYGCMLPCQVCILLHKDMAKK